MDCVTGRVRYAKCFSIYWLSLRLSYRLIDWLIRGDSEARGGKLWRELGGKGVIDKTWAIVKMREWGRRTNKKSEVHIGGWWLIDVCWETSLKPADVWQKKEKKLIEKKERTVIDWGILLWKDVWQRGGAIGELRAWMEGKRCLDVLARWVGLVLFYYDWQCCGLATTGISNCHNSYKKTEVFLFLIYASIFWSALVSHWCWCKLTTSSLFSFCVLNVV